MLRTSLKSLWARKVRLLLSTLSIVLGVAFVAGSLLFTALLRNSADELLTGTVGDVNVVAEGSSIPSGGEQSALIDELTVGDIAHLDGVERATGLVTGYTVYPLDADGNLISFTGAPGIASNWHDTPAAGGQTGPSIVDGRAPESDDEVVLDPSSLERGGYSLGDEVSVATPFDGIRSYTLVGAGTYGDGATAGASYLFFTLAEARAIVLDGQAGYTGVWIETSPDADPTAVAQAIEPLVGAGFEVQTGSQLADETQDQLDVGLGFVNIFLLVFAGISLLVATLLILNTFQILVAQRARELALLRAVGATRRQVRNSVLAEALVVGLAAATLGLAVGYGLAWGILAVMRGLGIDLGPTVPQLTWQSVVASYAVGVAVTVVAALVPAFRASAMRPVEAMAASSQSGPERLGGPQYVGIALIELGAAAIVCATLLPVPQPLVWLGLGVAGLLVGVVMSAAAVGRPVVWLLGGLFRATFGEVGRLAQLNAVRQPRRTAATAATLMIGVALVSAVAILAASTTTSLERRLTEDQRGDFIIAPVAYEPFDARVLDTVKGLDGVEKAYGYRRGAVRVGGDVDQVTLGGASREAIVDGTSLDVVAGSLDDGGGVAPALVDSDYATDHGLTIGQVIDLAGAKGSAQVLITGFHDGGTRPALGEIIVAPDTFAALEDDSLVTHIVVFADAGADRSAVEDELQSAVADLPTVAVSDVAEYTQARIDQFAQLFAVVYALLALAVIISVIGIVNTLGLSVMERTRELGLLRAVGLTRRQLRRMVTLESVIVATLGAVLGVVLGLVFGVSLVTLLADRGIDILSIPWLELVVFVVAAALVGVLAALGPARRAARMNVLESIAVD